jgi:hypothetical protein
MYIDIYVYIYIKKVYKGGMYALMGSFTPPPNFEFIPGFRITDITIESCYSRALKRKPPKVFRIFS